MLMHGLVLGSQIGHGVCCGMFRSWRKATKIIKILKNLEAKIGGKVGSFSKGVNDIVQEGRTKTAFKCVRSCYKNLGSNLFSVLFMGRARYCRISMLRIYSTGIGLQRQLVAAPF